MGSAHPTVLLRNTTMHKESHGGWAPKETVGDVTLTLKYNSWVKENHVGWALPTAKNPEKRKRWAVPTLRCNERKDLFYERE